MVGLRLTSEIIGNFRYSEGFLEVFEILKVFGNKILRVVASVQSFNIAYCDISALEHAYPLKIRHDIGTIRKLSTWSIAKKSQKFEKSTLNFFLDSAKLFPKIIIFSELSLSPAHSQDW